MDSYWLADEQVLRRTQGFIEKLGGKEPTEDVIREARWDTPNRVQLVPGYGHVVHVVPSRTDPRFKSSNNLAHARRFCRRVRSVRGSRHPPSNRAADM